MTISRWLLPCAGLVCSANTFAAATPFSDYLTCATRSFPVVAQAPFKSLVPQTVENGHIKLQGGSKSDMGQRWLFDKPVEVEGLTITGFFSENMDLAGSQIINWGFYVQQSPEQVAASVKKLSNTDLQEANGVFARPEIWSESRKSWLAEGGSDTAGKLVVDTSERVFMIEPAPADVHGSKAMLTCSLQGKISEAALNSSRPDLLPAR